MPSKQLPPIVPSKFHKITFNFTNLKVRSILEIVCLGLLCRFQPCGPPEHGTRARAHAFSHLSVSLWLKTAEFCHKTMLSFCLLKQLLQDDMNRTLIRQFGISTQIQQCVDHTIRVSSRWKFVLVFPPGKLCSSAWHIFTFLSLFCPLKAI